MVTTRNINPSFQYGAKKNIYKSALSSLYDKKKIWNQLKVDRHLRQKEQSLEKSRFTFYKKIYTIDNGKYYKVVGLDTDYYLKVDSLGYVSSSQFVVQLCHYTVNGMKCKRALLKIDKTKDDMLISESTLKIAFKPCKLESIS